MNDLHYHSPPNIDSSSSAEFDNELYRDQGQAREENMIQYQDEADGGESAELALIGQVEESNKSRSPQPRKVLRRMVKQLIKERNVDMLLVQESK